MASRDAWTATRSQTLRVSASKRFLWDISRECWAASSFSELRSKSPIDAPLARRVFATDNPIPDAPPVMKNTRPARLPAMLSFGIGVKKWTVWMRGFVREMIMDGMFEIFAILLLAAG